MAIDRRSFLTQIGTAVVAADALAGGACRGNAASAAAAQGAGPFRAADLRDRLAKDGEFGVTARYWTARVQVEIGSAAFMLNLSNGNLVDVTGVGTDGSKADVRISGPETVWR